MVGAPQDDGAAAGSGAAYVFAGPPWTQEIRLVPLSGQTGNRFGESVAIDDRALVAYAVVGAPQARNAAGTETTGAVYVFKRTILPSLAWALHATLRADDASSGAEFGPQLGSSVALAGEMLVVGAPHQRQDVRGVATVLETGALYSYRRFDDVWTPIGERAADVPLAYDGYGIALAGDDATVIVGAPFQGPSGPAEGAAYLYLPSDVATVIFMDGFEDGGTYGWGDASP